MARRTIVGSANPFILLTAVLSCCVIVANSWANTSTAMDAEVAMALYMAPATQHATETLADAQILAQRDELEILRRNILLSETGVGVDVHGLRKDFTEKTTAFIAALARRQRAYEIEVEAMRDALQAIAATDEGLDALRLFNDGQETEAVTVLDELYALNTEAGQGAWSGERLAAARSVARLAYESIELADVSAADVLERYETIVRHDPNVLMDWTQIIRLYILSGDLAGLQGSFERALESLERDEDKLSILRDLAELQAAMGDLRRAQESYQVLVQLAERLTARDPDNTEWLHDMQIAHNRIGDGLLRQQGDVPGALTHFEAGRAIGERLVAENPDNPGWQRGLLVAHQRIADVLLEQRNDVPGALRSFEAALAVAEQMVVRYPNQMEWRGDVSMLHYEIGNVQLAQGDLSAALDEFETGLALLEPLLAEDQSNIGLLHVHAAVHDSIGDVQRERGELSAALASYQEVLATRDRMALLDPRNTLWQRALVITSFKLFLSHYAEDDIEAAMGYMERAIEINRQLIEQHGSNEDWENDRELLQSMLRRVTRPQ